LASPSICLLVFHAANRAEVREFEAGG